jgi:hypothetical protein
MSVSVSPITKNQWGKVVKVFFYVGISFLLACIPVVLAHNATYIALAVPINVLLSTLEQLFKTDTTQAIAQTPAALQPSITEAVGVIESKEPPMNGVEQLTQPVTDSQGKLVTDPNAPR